MLVVAAVSEAAPKATLSWLFTFAPLPNAVPKDTVEEAPSPITTLVPPVALAELPIAIDVYPITLAP